VSSGSARFHELCEEWLYRPNVVRSTMMGYPCLRAGGDFFSCANKDGTFLTVKLSKERVLEAIDAGEAAPFAPNGRVFKEWASVPADRMDEWPQWMQEAHDFVANKSK
jgi:hypothetical protein